MSDVNIVDLKQATLNALIQRLGELTQAIVASNDRYASLAASLQDMEGRLTAQVRVAEASLQKHIGDVRSSDANLQKQITALLSELLSQTNQILTLQHDVLRLLLKDETAP